MCSSDLARYAPDDVSTDAARRERFLDGLNDELAVQLSVVHAPTYQSLLDKARILESERTQMENRKSTATITTRDHIRGSVPPITGMEILDTTCMEAMDTTTIVAMEIRTMK